MRTRPATQLILVWAALLGLLGITVATSLLELGGWNVVLNVTIAVGKALLIAVFFMHLRERDPLLRLTAAADILWLAFLGSLTLADYASR